jgi:hypothetical protein
MAPVKSNRVEKHTDYVQTEGLVDIRQAVKIMQISSF